MARPLIGVTGPDRGGYAMWLFTRLAVFRAGGRAVRIRPKRPRGLAGLCGLVLGGGADVGPALYGEEASELVETARREERTLLRKALGALVYVAVYAARLVFGLKSLSGADPQRDAMESALLDEALETGLPVLGICRGAQLINVHRGGTLHRDLSGFYSERPQLRTILPRKAVELAPGSVLAEVTGRRRMLVNALHDQAVDRLGQDVRVGAVEESGVVQAVECTDRAFVLGVQWHPEFLPRHRAHEALFRELVARAAAHGPRGAGAAGG